MGELDDLIKSKALFSPPPTILTPRKLVHSTLSPLTLEDICCPHIEIILSSNPLGITFGVPLFLGVIRGYWIL